MIQNQDNKLISFKNLINSIMETKSEYFKFDKQIIKVKSQQQANEIYKKINTYVEKGWLSGDDAEILEYSLNKKGFKNPKYK